MVAKKSQQVMPKQASFQTLCQTVSSVIPSATLHFREKNQIYLSVMDLSGVMLVSAKLQLQHNIDDDDFSVDIKDVEGVGDLSIEEGNYLVVRNGNITYRYERLVEKFFRELPEDKFKWKKSFELVEDLSPIIKVMEKKKDDSTSFTIKVDKSGLSFYDYPQRIVTIENREIVNEESLISHFSVDYIKLISSNFKYFDKVIIYLGNDYPLKIICTVENLEVIYFLAHRTV